jgi:hypothetical protein
MRMPTQRGSGLCSIEVDETGVKMRTALRRKIEIGREDITSVEVRKVRVPPFWWATNFYFVAGDGQRARYYFVAFRTGALRSAFERSGYTVVAP